MNPRKFVPLIRRLTLLQELEDSDQLLLDGIVSRVVTIPEGQDIVREGDRPTNSNVLLDGMVYRYKDVSGGGRQVLAFHLPGDIFDAQNFLLETMDHSVAALTSSTIGIIPHANLREVTETRPMIARAIWKDTLIDAAVFREWMTNLGRRPATPRMAHLICEMKVRQESIGMAEGDSIWWPMTQTLLSDALGLSVVHTNRCLQELRAAGTIESHRQRLRILDWPKLVEIGDFDPAYLQLGPLMTEKVTGG